MRAILPDEIFDGRHSVLDLIDVLRFALEGRHTVLIEPEFGPQTSPHTNAWLAQRSRDEREELHLALTLSLENEAKSERGIRTLCACGGPWREEGRMIHCSLADARAVLRRPLKILVENSHNDGAFVRRMLPQGWRTKLERCERESWAEFENGGGIGLLKEIINRLDSRLQAPRTVAIFDSDACAPKAPSTTSDEALAACQRKTVERLQLRRRAAENYLPPASLRQWSERTEPRFNHKRRARVFSRLTQEQRHHYSMRDGLLKDAQGDELPTLFTDLSEGDREALWRGFGNIRDLFIRDELFTESALESDDVHCEREALRALIFRNL